MQRFTSTLAALLLALALPAFGQEERPKVRIAEPIALEFDSVLSGTGRVAASCTSGLRARTASVVTKVCFPYGGKVKEGEVILELDDRAAKSAVKIKEAGVLRAKAALALPQRKLERAAANANSGIAANEVLDNAKGAVEEHTAALVEAEALLEAARLEVESCRVVAPFAGVLSRSRIAEGEQASPDAEPFAVLSRVHPAMVEATLPYQYGERIAEVYPQGLAGHEIVTRLGDKEYRTKVVFAQDTSSPREAAAARGASSRSFSVIVQLPEDESFQIGVPARVEVDIGKHQRQALPASAFQAGPAGFNFGNAMGRPLRPGAQAILMAIGDQPRPTTFNVRLDQPLGDYWSFTPELPPGTKVVIDENFDPRQVFGRERFVVEKLEAPK